MDGSTTEGPSGWETGQRLGPYRLLERLGTGGMGEVWLAEQQEPLRRKVGLKLIKAGLDTAHVIARFEAERQALALMDHPNISKVLDAGSTPLGRPYFVMEYVDGLPITEYCDRNQLDTSERLDLFMQVCEGVQHAHHKAVIHRDLKPSNVLVTEVDGRPTPKIIDFGVAKAMARPLTDLSLVTEFGQVIGTPAYLSPEQADYGREDVDTRTDVYALGMILYEILVGVLPFDAGVLRSGSFEDLRRVILETVPPRPSARITTLRDQATPLAAARRSEPRGLAMRLQGELDWIVLRALEKERERRYDSVHDLRADILRYLQNEPVLARPPSNVYRWRKFVRRNRAVVFGVSAVTAVLFLGVVGSSWGFLRAREAERAAAAEAMVARRQAAIAEAVNRFLNDDLLAAVAPSARKGRGRDVLMRDVLDVASERIESAVAEGGSLAEEPVVEAAIRATLGTTYQSLGVYDVAASHLERSAELRRAIPGQSAKYAAALAELALLNSQWGRYAAAESLYVLCLELRSAEASVDTLTQLVPTAFNLATLYQRQGHYAKAESLFVFLHHTLRRLVGEEHDRSLMVMNNLANLYQELGRLPEAEDLQSKVLATRLKEGGEEDPSTLFAMNNLANTYWSQGYIDKAEELLVRTLELKRRVLGPEHPSTLNSSSGIGSLHATRGDYETAERLQREILETRGRVLGVGHPITQTSRNDLAYAILKQGRFREALDIAEETATTCRSTLGDTHPTTLTAIFMAALCHAGEGRLTTAEPLLRQVAASAEAGGSVEPAVQALFEAHLGLVLGRLGQREEATKTLEHSLPSLQAWEDETSSILRSAISLYDAWSVADPATEYGERAAEARELLMAEKPASPE